MVTFSDISTASARARRPAESSPFGDNRGAMADPPPPPPDGFAARVRSALAWRWGSQLAAQIVTWTSTLIVVRLLDPADYGLFAMTQVVLAALNFLNGYSFATSLIQADEVDDRRIGQVFRAAVAAERSAGDRAAPARAGRRAVLRGARRRRHVAYPGAAVRDHAVHRAAFRPPRAPDRVPRAGARQHGGSGRRRADRARPRLVRLRRLGAGLRADRGVRAARRLADDRRRDPRAAGVRLSAAQARSSVSAAR